MNEDITEITVILQAEYLAASDPPKHREAIQHIYEEVQDWIVAGIKQTARSDDFYPDDIVIDWDKGEITATAAVRLKFKFVRQQDLDDDQIEITRMDRFGP